MMRTYVRLSLVALATVALIPTTQGLAQSSARQVTDDDADDEAPRLICRREVETGSLAKGRRVCLTRAQLERQAERQARAAVEVQERMRTSPSGE